MKTVLFDNQNNKLFIVKAHIKYAILEDNYLRVHTDSDNGHNFEFNDENAANAAFKCLRRQLEDNYEKDTSEDTKKEAESVTT